VPALPLRDAREGSGVTCAALGALLLVVALLCALRLRCGARAGLFANRVCDVADRRHADDDVGNVDHRERSGERAAANRQRVRARLGAAHDRHEHDRVTPRIRRGTTTSGTLVGEANAEQVKAAAGSTEPFFITVCEDRSDVATVDYNLTLQQTAASANGSALQGTILVFVR
jgi:hypothetical protein